MLLPSEISTKSSKLYSPLKPLRKSSTSLSNLFDNTSDYIPSQESTSSLFVQHHRYNLRNFPSRRLSTDTSTLNLSARSSNSALRLARKHAQPLSSDTHSSELDPQSYFTSGLENASLLSSDVQTERGELGRPHSCNPPPLKTPLYSIFILIYNIDKVDIAKFKSSICNISQNLPQRSF